MCRCLLDSPLIILHDLVLKHSWLLRHFWLLRCKTLMMGKAHRGQPLRVRIFAVLLLGNPNIIETMQLKKGGVGGLLLLDHVR